MAESIAGLSVKISADTKDFNKSFKDMKKSTNSMKGEVDALVKSLEMDFDPSKMEKAQKKCQEALDATADQAQILKERLKYLEDGGNIDTSEYKSLEAELAKTELTAQKLEKQLKKLGSMGSLNALGSKIENVGNKITSLGKGVSVVSGVAAGAGAALGKLGLDAVATADDIATLASKYNITATELQRLQYIALQSDVSNESLYKSLVKTRAAVTDLGSGIENNASKALASLNLNLANLSEGEQFNAIISSLANMENKTQMLSIANEIFGDKLANEMLPLIYQGSEAINQYSKEFETVGALTDEQVAKLSEFDNVMNKIKAKFSNAIAQIGSALLPLMESVANVIEQKIIPKLQALSDWFDLLSEGQLNMIAKITLIVAALGPVIILIGKLTSGIGAFIKMLPGLNAQLSALSAHPIIAIIGVVAGILLLLYTRSEAFRESINMLVSTLGSALTPIFETILSVLQPIVGLIGTLAETLGDTLAPVITIITAALTPIIEQFKFMMGILQPLIQLALIPMQLQLKALQVPLKILGSLLGWLTPIFTGFSDLVKSVFEGVIYWINKALALVEDAINWVIDKVNAVISGLNMIPGVNISKIDRVNLQIGGSVSDDAIEETAAGTTNNYVYDYVDTSDVVNATTNYDYSTNNTTQNVTVTIENYAAEVDTNALVNEINLKLRGLMY